MDRIENMNAELNLAPPQKIAPRMLITKLVMENFKSYGGVREIGPFHKCFSSVVGPNGSGKSNVIDAMLFVFGKRAKKLRLNKVSELIHRSDMYPNLDSAKVSVHFINIIDDQSSEDDYTEVEGSGLVVTRTAYRNNTSKYHLDGKAATFTEVGTILRERGIDLDNNRFLILQGEVEQIAMMKPKAEGQHDEGLLEYLEDIIGSNRHVEAAEVASKEVEALSEQRIEKLNRLKAAEKDKDSLEGSKAEAEELLRKEKKLREKRNVLYQICITEANKNAETVKERWEELTHQLEVERERLADSEVSMKEIEGKYEEMTASYNIITEELISTKEEFAEYERKDIKYQEDIKHLNSQTKKLEASVKKDAKTASECEERAENCLASLPTLEKRKRKAEKQVEEAEKNLELENGRIRKETEGLRATLEVKQSEAAPVIEAHAALQRSRDTTAYEASLIEDAVKKVENRLASTERALNELIAKERENQALLASSQNELVAINQEKSEVQAKLEDLKSRESIAVLEMSQAVSKAEEAKAAQEASDGTTGALKALLDAARPGKPLESAGIRGRLGGLGAISAEFDVAISTACGLLDHIVVDTSAGGTACVEYLREHGLGRASFIILDQLDHLRQAMSNNFSPPPNCQRLFDLIQPADKRYSSAFYLGLHDTLVASDLDVATGVAYRNGQCMARVVTLTGQLIDKSGAMSGGGTNVRRGGMGSTFVSESPRDPLEMRRLTELATTAQKTVQTLRQQKNTLQEELKRLTARLIELEGLVPRVQLQSQGAMENKKQYMEQIKTLQAQCHLTPENEARLQELKAKLKSEDAELSKSAKLVKKVEVAVADLQKAILDAGGEELKKAQAEAERAAACLDAAVAAIAAANVDESTNRRKAEKAKADQVKKEIELEVARAHLERVMGEHSQLEEAALTVITAYEETKKVADERKKQLEDSTKVYKQCCNRIAKIRSVEVDICHQLEEYTTSINENEQKAKHWTNELSKLRTTHAQEEAEWGDLGTENLVENTEIDDMDVDVNTNEAELENTTKPKNMLENLSREVLANYKKEDLQYEIGSIEAERNALKANVNMSALLEYRRKENDYLARVRDLEQVTELRNLARRKHEELRRLRLEEFMTGFGTITLKLKEMYQMITLGGDAELELVDSLDPFSEGIVFSVRPPKKSWKRIANLSGGEKTLSSLALVFALHHYRPTPLYVMDEIDAALDFKNVSIVANYIKERTKNAQFVIISLRNNMFELADRLVGIYKTNDVTKSVTINPKLYAGMELPLTHNVLRDQTNLTNRIT